MTAPHFQLALREAEAQAALRGLRAVVVDDEPLALRRLSAALISLGVEVVGTALDGRSGLDVIREMRPDIAFLDVKMPGVSGIELAEQLLEREPPAIIFVTAFSRFACQAFDAAAVDYILKPFSMHRLNVALQRAGRSLEAANASERIGELRSMIAALRQDEAEAEPAGTGLEVETWAKARDGAVKVRFADLEWIEAVGDYVRLHLAGRGYLRREPLQKFAERLDPSEFVRIHRSTIVRISMIASLSKGRGRDLSMMLTSGEMLPVSRRCAHIVRSITRV